MIETRPHYLTPAQRLNEHMARQSQRDGNPYAHHRPVDVHVQVASTCNIDCYMCAIHNLPDGSRRGKGLRPMSPELFQTLVDEVFPYSRRVTFGIGGEPMISEHFERFVQQAYEMNQEIYLVTNGTRIKKDSTAELLAKSIAHMQVSIDSCTKENYERIRIGSYWNSLQENLARLRKARMKYPPELRSRLTYCMVLMRSNIHELPDFVTMAHEHGADVVRGQHVIPVTPEGTEEQLLFEPERYHHFRRLATERAKELGILIDLPADYATTTEANPDAIAALQTEQMAANAESATNGNGSHAGNGATHVEHQAQATPAVATPPAKVAPPAPEPVAPAATQTPEPVVAPAPAPAPEPVAPPASEPIPTPDEVALGTQCSEIASKATPSVCSMPYSWFFMFFDGRVYPCCHPDVDPKLFMGDLSKQSFEDIWNGLNFQNLRRGLATPEPYPVCNACPIARRNERGDLSDTPEAEPLDAANVGSDTPPVAQYYAGNGFEPIRRDSLLVTARQLGVLNDPPPQPNADEVAENARIASEREQLTRLRRERELLLAKLREVDAERARQHEYASNLEAERPHWVEQANSLQSEHERLVSEIHDLRATLRNPGRLAAYLTGGIVRKVTRTSKSS